MQNVIFLIYFLHYTSLQYTEALPVLSGLNMKRFDFDYKRSSILWIEDDSLVKMLVINSTWTSKPMEQFKSSFFAKKVLFELGSATGSLMSLSVDWINNLLYYSYTDLPNHYIKVTDLPTAQYHYTVFTSKQDKPSVVAVNPKLRYLYWIDQGQYAKLERAFLNGSNRTVLVNTEITTPTDLFVDVATGNVYWSDNTYDRIEMCDFEGKGGF